MGRVANDMENLSTLINNTDSSSVSVDEIPTEIKRGPGRPKKKVVSYYTYCGMAVPNEIYDICMFLESLLKEQGKYSPALAPQIFNAAVQCWTYNDLITNKITQREPISTRQLTTASESYRRALQSLGLTVVDKKSGITKEQTETNPLQVFLDKMNDDGDDKIVVKKSKRKGGH